mmetsp:Transcript_16770/g.36490  ORF Transcript_16770/g.36490 Transcript_16770/m.36490 type:complete len:80 (-) Transcript_16770:87-326(-)
MCTTRRNVTYDTIAVRSTKPETGSQIDASRGEKGFFANERKVAFRTEEKTTNHHGMNQRQGMREDDNCAQLCAVLCWLG